MAKTNVAVKTEKVFTHEGATAQKVSALAELRRSLMTCMLWEDTFYEGGDSIAERIKTLTLDKSIAPKEAVALAIEAKEKMYLRHAPLWMARWLVNRRAIYAKDLARLVGRADELAEFLALYWKDGRTPIAPVVKRALALAFGKFDAYQLAKYNRDEKIKLRDVMFLTHPKPTEKQAESFKALAGKTLESPGTWEVELSSGKNKKEVFERLLRENKLGGMATLRNLRNMAGAGVDEGLVRNRLEGKFPKVLPFRFIAAARYAPQWEDSIEKGMLASTETLEKLPGKTALLIDISGSMTNPLSARSEMTRMDAACGLAIFLREKADECSVAVYTTDSKIVPARRGFALRDAICSASIPESTYLKRALIKHAPLWANYDRLIVITDEQSHDGILAAWTPFAYVINVAPYQFGLSYGNGWTHIDGWSEKIIDYIRFAEQERND